MTKRSPDPSLAEIRAYKLFSEPQFPVLNAGNHSGSIKTAQCFFVCSFV